MKSWLSVAVFAATAFAAAVPTNGQSAASLFKRATTPDGTCGITGSGAGNGYTCSTSSYKCCSQYGWCGDDAEHCGTGCQSAYGTCSGTTTPTDPPTTNPPTSGRPKPGSVPYGSFVYSCTRPGFVALTFDDGPHIYTPQLLDLLKANGVVATFFLNGQNWGDIITTPSKVAIVQRMLAEGHQIGSHTWSHPDMSTLSVSELTSQMTQLESAFVNMIGKYPTYMRPPFFSCDQECLDTMGNLGYHVIHSDLDTLDWQNNTPQTIQNSKNIFANAVNNASPSSQSFISLMHDVHETTVTSLVQDAINKLKARGFRATTVGWCLSDHSNNWYRT